MEPPSLEASLLQDALPRAGIDIVVRRTGYRYRTWFGRMFVLSVASTCAAQDPPVIREEADRIAHFRHLSPAAYRSRSRSPNAAWAAARRAMGTRLGEQLT